MKIRYEQPKTELAPDLEWMLSSQQVSPRLLLETLVNDYTIPIYQIAFSILDDPMAAKRTVRDTFSAALLNIHHYRALDGVENWLDRLAWKVCMRIRRREKVWRWLEKRLSLHGELTNSNQSAPANELEASIWQAVDELAEPVKLVFIFNRFLGWPAEKISHVTGMPIRQVEVRLGLAAQEISGKIEVAEFLEGQINDPVAEALKKRWPAPDIDKAELEKMTLQVEKQARQGKLVRGPYVLLGEMAVLIAVAIVVLGLAWWGNRLSIGQSPPRHDSSLPTPTLVVRSTEITLDNTVLMPRNYSLNPSYQPTSSTTETPEGIFYIGPAWNALDVVARRLGVTLEELRRFNHIPEDVQTYRGQWLWIPARARGNGANIAAPVPPFPNNFPLKVPKIAEDLNKLLYPSRPAYHTVWVDALISVRQDSIPSSQPQQLRIQLWLSPGQGLLLGGPVNQDPTEAMLWKGEEEYIARPGTAMSTFQNSLGQPDSAPVSVPLTYAFLMMMKATDIWDSPNLIYIEPGSFAGRQTWIVELANSQNEPMTLVHLDKETGFVLHDQNLKPDPPGLSLPDEITVRKIVFDANFPKDVFDPQSSWIQSYAMDYSGSAAPVDSTH